MGTSAAELHERAVDLSIEGRYGPALRAAEAGLAVADDPDMRARLLGTKAVILQRTGAPAAADEVCRRARAIRGISDHTRAILDGQLGALAMYGGRLDDADRSLTAAISGLQDDPVAAARVRINRSLQRLQQRRLADAADDLRVAVAALEEHGLRTDAAQARHNLGYIALLAGDLIAAQHDMLAAKREAATSAVATAIGDVDRAEVLRDAGLTAEAEQVLAASAAVFGRQRMPQSRAEAEVALARSQLTHDPAAAARTAATAARRFRSLGNETGAARADAIRLRALLSDGAFDARGIAKRRRGRAPSADEIDAVAAALRRAGLRTDAVAIRFASELAALRGSARRQRRREQVRAVPVRVPPNAPIDLRLLAHEVRVARAAARGREAELRRHAAAGVEELARWQASFGSLDLQASVTMHGVPLLMAGLSSALRSQRPELVFEWSERARHASQQVVPLRPPPDEEAAAALAELRMLRSEASGAEWLASERAAELHDLVRERQWTSTGSAGVHRRVGLAELQGALDDETAMLAYVWSEGVLACVAVRRDRARLVPLPDFAEVRAALAGLRADLDVSAAVRSGPMAAVVQRALDERLAALSRMLLDAPLPEIDDARRIVVTAPGVLAGIPWAMLPGLRDRVFTLAVSATRWVGYRTGAWHTERSAGPRERVPRGAIAVGPRVARGDEEADAAAAAWTRAGGDVALLRGPAATVDAVAELAAESSVLHIAAHGRHTSDNPLFSGLELADGTLFGYDIDRIPRLPDAVVLSACEVGRSSVRWGEEALGMTRTWLHAGARCVIAAPVVVADDVACELLGEVHTGLAAGEPAAEALAAASRRTGLVTPFECHGAGF
ncbi:CHAT domain-containing protein [Microbacterium sp.]|uniref:CHAT domain-containing protein n=1 Tax=Microbacterium sp. TaxID=51671 RepID=UPI0037CC1CC4